MPAQAAPAASAEPVLVGQVAGESSLSDESGTAGRDSSLVLSGAAVGGLTAGASASASPTGSAGSAGASQSVPVGRAHRANLATSQARPVDDMPRSTSESSGSAVLSSSSDVGLTPAPTEPAPMAGVRRSDPVTAPVGAKTTLPGGPSAGAPASRVPRTDGAMFSMAELIANSGLSEAYMNQLREFGLISPASIAGGEYFDEDALAVAKVAAEFSAFGIEARHLRLYKNAADREAGFIEQIVIPMVRQRNPEARARAVESADELARLGQELKGSLLRSALGSLLNG